MSISSRISSMEEHVTNAYNGLQGLGADLTGIDKNIDNIASVLDDIYNDLPKVTGSGTTVTLEDTRKGRLESTLSGNTSQFTTTGKNLLPNERATITENGITITKNDDGSYKVNGTASADVSLAINENTFISMSGTWRMLGCPSGGSENTYMLSAYVGYWGTASPNIDTGNGTNITYTGNVKVRFYIKSGTTCNNLIFKPMLTTDTTATINNFEPYTGGQASPNPDYPQEVHVVKGDNKITVCGKNMFDDSIVTNIWSNYSTQQLVTANGSNLHRFDCKQGDTFTLSATFDTASSNGAILIQFFDENGNSLGRNASSQNTNPTLTKTAPANTSYAYIGRYLTAPTTIQLERNTQATSYEPYQSQSYSVNLGSIELCKIGDYQDYIYKEGKKWYKYNAIQKYDAWDTVSMSTTHTNTNTYQFLLPSPTTVSLRANVLSNYFQNQINNNDIEHLFIGTGRPSIYNGLNVFINNTTAADSSATKTWLKNNGVVVYYVLETPTTEEITDSTLISQLEALRNAESYEGQTNISQVNNDLPFIISASALKEWSV